MRYASSATATPHSTLSPETWPRMLRDGCCVLLLVLQPVLFFWHVLVNPSKHIPFDIEGFHLPLISYISQCVRSGIAPLWDPYPYCGVPIHADSQAQLFYPFTWLAIFAGNHTQGHKLYYWVETLVPLHMVLAGIFTYVLLRRIELCRPAALFGATVFQLGGFFASQAQHLGAISSAPWLPLAILAVFELRFQLRARWIAVLGIAVAMSILAGFAATTLVIAGAIALLVIGLLVFRDASWRMVPGVAAGFILGAAIAAVQLAPLWQLSRSSMVALRGTWFTTGGGLTAHTLVSLVFPNYYHIFDLGDKYKLPYNFTYLYAYCGLATVVLLAVAPFVRNRRAILFLILTIVSVFWMLGSNTPVYGSIFVHLPTMLRGALYAEYALLAFCCFAAIAAAMVLHHAGKRLPRVVLWAVALAAGYDLIQTGRDRPMNAFRGGYKTEDSEYGSAHSPAFSAKLRSLANETTPPSRIDYMDKVYSHGVFASDMLRIPTASGDNPFVLLRTLNLRRLFTSGLPWERQLVVDRPGSPLLKMMNVQWLVSSAPVSSDQAAKAGLEPVDSLDGFQIYRNPGALPRFFLVPRIRRSSGETETLKRLAEESFNGAEEAVVEGISEDREQLARGEVNVAAYSPNRVELTVESRGPGFLATSEAMYPGWEARVNGKEQPLFRTNSAFRGLFVAPGPSRIVMEYHPRYFVPAATLSVAALLAAMLAMLRGDRPPKDA